MANFDWSKDQDNGFSEDRLKRAQIAEFLTDYLATEGAKRNYVLNVNAEWGAGKTYFLKRWQHSIKNKHPVVYIDAWQQDFSDDPLLTVVSSIIDQLQNQHGSQGDVTIQKAARGVLGLFKVAAPFVAKAVVKKVSGIDTDEFADKLKAEGAFDMAASDVAGKFVEGLLEDHANKKKSIDHFKASIKKWASNIKGTTNLHPPIFIFIDELDRCRPTYAIEMLEVIKHLFDMEGVVFVVATDTQQLQHAIKVIYGEGFDASTYLGRFFNRRITLKHGNTREYIQNLPQFSSLESLVVGHEGFWPSTLTKNEMLDQVCIPIESYDLDLRTADRIIDRLVAILDHTEDKPLQIDLLFLSTLLCINEKDHNLYEHVTDTKSLPNKKMFGEFILDKSYNKHSDINEWPAIAIRLSYDGGGLFNTRQSHDFSQKVGIFSTLQTKIKCLSEPIIQKKNSDNQLQNKRMELMRSGSGSGFTTNDYETMLFISHTFHPEGRRLATWSDYLNWVELASSFDE